jgi:hypothetical protein
MIRFFIQNALRGISAHNFGVYFGISRWRKIFEDGIFAINAQKSVWGNAKLALKCRSHGLERVFETFESPEKN